MRLILILLAWCLGICAVAQQSADPYVLDTLFQRIPPLSHDAHGRLPLITWEPFRQSATDDSFSKDIPLPVATYTALAQRGLAQAIPLTAKAIPLALAMQQAGMAVVVMEGNGGDAPGALEPDALHKLPRSFDVEGAVHPCPLLLAGWHTQAMALRATLKAFKDAGVTIDAAWLDWENEPLWGSEEWEQARHCPRCQELFSPGVLDEYPTYRDFIVRFRQQLFSTYLAAPIREAFPKCVVTNWAVVHSSPERLTLHYWGRFRFPPMTIGLFTATNPVAYGNDIEYSLLWDKVWANRKETPLDQPHMDQLYTYVMLSQISEDTANAQRWAPETLSIPWVCRYCPDMDDAAVPMMSRTRYRELLRHLWLRGADSLQIFNAFRPNHPELRLQEVEDAVTSYDEALRYRTLLEHGTVMNTHVPGVMEAGAVWSGLRGNEEAVVRAFAPGLTPVTFALSVWDDAPLQSLLASPEGATYHFIRRHGVIETTRE